MVLVEQILDESIDFSQMKSQENVSVVPILLKEIVRHKSLTRSLDEKKVEILESDSVNVLKIKIKEKERPILIPFLQIVGGGKQDRMVTQPIIIPEYPKERIISIPVNCIEQGRWSYNRPSGETSSEGFYAQKMARMSPSLGSLNYMSGQGQTWRSIAYHKAKLNMYDQKYASSSYMSMSLDLAYGMESGKQEKTNLEKETIDFLKGSDKLIENQCGLAFFIDNTLIGLEIYGSPELWEDHAEGVINSFLTELAIRDTKKEQTDYDKVRENFQEFVKNLKLKENKDKKFGSGKLQQTDFKEDYSALLLEDEAKAVEFYYAKKFEEARKETIEENHLREYVQQVQEQGKIEASRRSGSRRIGNALVIENQKVNYSDELNKNWNINSLTIKNNSLKEIPKEVEKLTQLTLLDLRENKLEKLPNFIGKLQQLEYIMLDNNEISELPEAMKNLSNLGRLYLANNRIKSIHAIKSVLMVPELRILDLRGNSGLGSLALLFSGKHEIEGLRKQYV